MVERSVQVINRNGLHARPAAEIVKAAAKFRSDITIVREDLEVNGKSIMGVMMLAANKGSKIVLETEGDEEVVAIDALVALIEDKFGEGA